MLNLQSRLHPNAEEVAAKVMDGEAILINLANGIYYSMDQVGGLIWELIECGYSLEEMMAAIATHYEVSAEQAQTDVERLTADLLQENLVLLPTEDVPRREHSRPTSESKLVYASPQLNIYRDMGDLLALDPPTPELELTPWQAPDEPPSYRAS